MSVLPQASVFFLFSGKENPFYDDIKGFPLGHVLNFETRKWPLNQALFRGQVGTTHVRSLQRLTQHYR